MVYNPELVKQILGDEVAKLFDGTIKIIRSDNEIICGNLRVGDTLEFKFKENNSPLRQFKVE